MPLHVLSLKLSIECKQNHVSNVNKVKSSRISFYMQIFRNLMTESCSNKTIEYTYGTDFPEFQISKIFPQTYQIALKL